MIACVYGWRAQVVLVYELCDQCVCVCVCSSMGDVYVCGVVGKAWYGPTQQSAFTG